MRGKSGTGNVALQSKEFTLCRYKKGLSAWERGSEYLGEGVRVPGRRGLEYQEKGV